MEERLRFVARLLDGEPMTDVCRDFGISRKTGYKIFDRYREHGLVALTDRSLAFLLTDPSQFDILQSAPGVWRGPNTGSPTRSSSESRHHDLPVSLGIAGNATRVSCPGAW
jgi:hypothetical protein